MLLVLKIPETDRMKSIYTPLVKLQIPFIILIIVYTKDHGLRVVDEFRMNAAGFTAVNTKSYFYEG